MKKLIERMACSAKGADYHMDKEISTSQLLKIAIGRARMLVRGFFKKSKFKKAGKRLFVGKRVRLRFCKRIQLGSTVTINDGCIINGLCSKTITIGNNFSLGENSIIDCTGVLSNLGESLIVGNNVGISPNFTMFVRGPISIGDDVIIGPNVTIVSENHRFDDVGKPIRLQGVDRKGITIGNNCWIGANATILDGVTIGENSVIAAGAVVTKNVEPNTAVGGVPAKLLKRLDRCE